TTVNSGRILINLKPLEQRQVDITTVINRLQPKLAAVEAMTLFLQPVQDLTVEDRVSRTQYQYSLEDPSAAEVSLWTGKLVDKLKTLPALRNVATDQQNRGQQEHVVIDRLTASRLGITPNLIDNTLYDAFSAIAQARQEIGMPASIEASFQGTAAAFRASLKNEPLLILAALVTVYIVLGILYESYIHPVTIISTLPSAGVGAILALMICGQDLNVIALIGIILLIGIVKKNAIMMIDFALEAQRKDGKPPREAILQACLLRFRPIMMTTMAALLGALPLALGTGTGSELRRPLGIAIVGGFLVSQVLTLYTTPVIFLTFDRLAARVAQWRTKDVVPETTAAQAS